MTLPFGEKQQKKRDKDTERDALLDQNRADKLTYTQKLKVKI